MLGDVSDRPDAVALGVMTLSDLLLDLLAGYRLTRVVIDDSIDFPPTAALRRRAERALDGSSWAQVLDCPWCASAWVGLGIVGARRVAPAWWRPAAFALAVSAAAGLLHNAEQALAAAANHHNAT